MLLHMSYILGPLSIFRINKTLLPFKKKVLLFRGFPKKGGGTKKYINSFECIGKVRYLCWIFLILYRNDQHVVDLISN